MKASPVSSGPMDISANTLSLLSVLNGKLSRQDFINKLSDQLRQVFSFDRLCINLYDPHDGMLSLFTSAQGTLVSTLSPLRPAEEQSTVAGHVIATRRPVIIPDLGKHFSSGEKHPMEEAGLKATIAVPLFLFGEILGTLHCAFTKAPDNMQEITSFLSQLSTAIAPCLEAILSHEQHAQLPPLFREEAPNDDSPILYRSKIMRDILRQVDMVAKFDIPVLLLGETGTGKSVVARYIHNRSTRNTNNFVKVNCPALSPSLFESELFGHSRGAFTGAYAKRVGRIELAHLGTLFLDEIGDISLEMQSKLLQVLEDSKFERVGESTPLSVDFRLVSATNISVTAALESGAMRADLYHRLSCHVVALPPLRERREDVPLYAKAFMANAAARMGLSAPMLAHSVMKQLMDHDWPGNLRELYNRISRLIVIQTIEGGLSTDVVNAILKENSDTECQSTGGGHNASLKTESRKAQFLQSEDEGNFTLAEFEKKYIIKILKKTGGIISGTRGAAALLGIPRSTLLHKIKKLGIPHQQGNGKVC